MKQKSKIAVIGLGNIGTVVATNLVKSNRSVIVADRKIEKANRLSQKLGNIATPSKIADAIKEADIVVLATWFDVTKELFNTYAKELEAKIIVDPSNPIAPHEKGGFKKVIDKDNSSGQILSSLLPKNAKLVKALGTLGVASLSKAAFQEPDRAVLFYAVDDRNISPVVEELIRDSGFEPLYIGGLDQSIRIEVFGDLHEFGALGKTITRNEARLFVEPEQHLLTHI